MDAQQLAFAFWPTGEELATHAPGVDTKSGVTFAEPPGPTALCFTCRQWLPREVVSPCDCCGEPVCACCRQGGAHARHVAAYTDKRTGRLAAMQSRQCSMEHFSPAH